MPLKSKMKTKRANDRITEHAEVAQTGRDEDTCSFDRDEKEGDDEAGPSKYEVFDKVVAFFEDRPYFYDVGDENFSNKKRKDAELADFARSMNWTCNV